LQWRLIRSKTQRMTSLWKMTPSQISKLKAGSQCAGNCPSVALMRRARFHSTPEESPSRGVTFHGDPLGGSLSGTLSGRSVGAVTVPVGTAPAPHTGTGSQGLWSGTRDH
jgi:hypothetical protein